MCYVAGERRRGRGGRAGGADGAGAAEGCGADEGGGSVSDLWGVEGCGGLCWEGVGGGIRAEGWDLKRGMVLGKKEGGREGRC